MSEMVDRALASSASTDSSSEVLDLIREFASESFLSRSAQAASESLSEAETDE